MTTAFGPLARLAAPTVLIHVAKPQLFNDVVIQQANRRETR